MVIGYGFRDKCINNALIRAADTGLQLFVVDPWGSELGTEQTPGAARALRTCIDCSSERSSAPSEGASRTLGPGEVQKPLKLQTFFNV